jgi:hypothetical protein
LKAGRKEWLKKESAGIDGPTEIDWLTGIDVLAEIEGFNEFEATEVLTAKPFAPNEVWLALKDSA